MPNANLVSIVARALAGQARRELANGRSPSTPKEKPAVVAAGGTSPSSEVIDAGPL